MRGSILKVTWDKIRTTVRSVNVGLADVIDKLSPGEEFYLYKVAYPFGSKLSDRGLFHIPLENGEIVPITDPRVDVALRADLQYADRSAPVGIILKNTHEVFISTPQYTLPILVAYPGSVFGLWKQLDNSPTFHPTNIFSVTAGARSLFMLPNIANYTNHKNLVRDFHVSKQAPKTLQDQWPIFKTIAQQEQADWRLELLLIPEKWIKQAKIDPAWHEFYRMLLENAWHSCAYERNQIFYEFALSCVQANRNLKPNPYLLDTVRHVLSITLGSAPGFKAATDELLGPITLLQKAYVESYRLKDQAPILLHPAHFNIHDPASSPVYYSMQFPTTISFSPRSRQLTNTLLELREFKYIMDVFLHEINARNVHLEDTIIDMLPQKVKYDYFHTKPDLQEGIQSTLAMTDSDPNFLDTLYKQEAGEFPSNGTFIRGCIKIGAKERE
ncbi:MAG: hypothetical protein HKM04_10130 [Legionellales bacterium]|nr:hypothetical protein [Legionellales bacterium]